MAATRPALGKPNAVVMASATWRHRGAARRLAGTGRAQQRVDGALGIGTQRAVHRDALRGERVERGLLALDLLLGGGLGVDPQRNRRVEDQPGDLVRTRSGVGQRHLGAVADPDERDGGHVPQVAQPLDVRGGVRVVVGRLARRDGVGAVRGGGVRDVGQVGHRIVAGLELRLIAHRLAVGRVAAVDRARHAHAAAVDGDDGVSAQHVGARPRQPDRQLGRRRQVRAGGEDQRPGVVRGLVGAGADHADAQGPGSAVGVEVGVVVRAVQLDARRRRNPGVGEQLRRAVVPGQVVLGCRDRGRTDRGRLV